jgi:cobalamin biosynthesis Mg chelatase CobN
LAWGISAAPAAHAASPHLVLSPASGPPGTSVVASGTGFCASPCTRVEIEFSGLAVAGNVAVTANGSFSVRFTVPAGTVGGSNNVAAMQQEQGGVVRQASATFNITPSQPPPNVSVPRSTPNPTTRAPTTSRPTSAPTSPANTTASTPDDATSTTRVTTSRSTSTSTSSPTGSGAAASSSSSGDNSGNGWIPWLVAALVVVAAGGGAWWFTRRRRRQSSP